MRRNRINNRNDWLRELASFLSEREVPLGFGGRIFVEAPSLQPRIGGHYLGDELAAAATAAERLLARSEPAPQVETTTAEYLIAHDHLASRIASLESALATSLAVQGQSPPQFASASRWKETLQV